MFYLNSIAFLVQFIVDIFAETCKMAISLRNDCSFTPLVVLKRKFTEVLASFIDTKRHKFVHILHLILFAIVLRLKIVVDAF